MRLLIALLSVAALSGCMGEPVGTTRTNNTAFQVEELFTHNGVTVYRFYDGGTVYFTSRGDVQHTVHHGKTSHEQQTVNGAW
jgi:hypothetical protein